MVPTLSATLGVKGHHPQVGTWDCKDLLYGLAVVNVLPLPPLDGGRVAVSLIQAALGNRVSATFERYVYLAGFVFLMAMLAWVTLFDTGILQRSTGL